MMGLIYGDYGGRSDEFAPGGFSYENGFCPHGGVFISHMRSTQSLIWLNIQCPMTSSRRPPRPNWDP